MPLKYKKLVLLFSFGIMLIGLGTFSLLSPGIFHQAAKSVTNPEAFDNMQITTFAGIGSSGADTEEIEKMIRDYFQAKQQVDMDTIEKCVSNVGHVDEKKLLAESAYVEEYDDIQCMFFKGETNGAYRVYVYYNVKIYDIDTKIPSLNALYIKKNKKGSYQIYLDTLSSKEQKYIDQLDNSEKVKKLVSSVQSQLESVVSTDSDVREFYEMLEHAGSSQEKSKKDE